MSTVLQCILALAVLALCAYLIPLLIQLRRTAAELERFSRSASKDLGCMAEDVRRVRERVEGLADSASQVLRAPSLLSQAVAGAIQGIPAFLGRREKSSGWMQSLLAGIEFALTLFKRAQARPSKEANHE